MMRKTFLFILLIATLSASAFAQSKRDEGIELYQQAKYTQAIDALQEAVSADKKDRLGRMFLGAALYRAGRSGDAAKEFRKGNVTIKEMAAAFDSGVEITSKPRASYTDAARTNNTQGVVRLAVEFLADGKIGFAVPVQSLPDGLTENCRSVAKSIKFKPAQKNGVAVTTVAVVEYWFEIY